MQEKQESLPGMGELSFKIAGGETVRARQGSRMAGLLIDNAPFLSRNTTSMPTIADEAGSRAIQARNYVTRPRKDPRRYAEFYGEALPLSQTDISARTSEKRELLLTHFPSRFGSKGAQPIAEYTPTQIGGLYLSMVATARKYLPDQAS